MFTIDKRVNKLTIEKMSFIVIRVVRIELYCSVEYRLE